MKNLKRYFLISMVSITTLTLTGCGLQPVHNNDTKNFIINPSLPTPKLDSSAQTHLTLLVELPKASQAYDTQQMAYVTKAYQLNYFSHNQWADTLPQMLHPLLLQSLQNTGYFHAVMASPNGGLYNMTLITRLLQLQQNFLTHPSQIQLSLRAQLINNASHTIIATKQFTINEPAPEDTPYGGVIAANNAVYKLLQQINQFCVNNTKR